MKKNEIIIEENIIKILIKRLNGEVFECLIDKEDYELVKDYRWKITPDSHTLYVQGRRKGRGKLIPIHRILLNISDGNIFVDHIDGNGLNNLKSNLRKSNYSDNNKNSSIRKDNTTGYKGVTKNKNKYIARIQNNKKRITIGSYNTAEEAALAYNEYSLKLHKDLGKLNEIK